MRIFCASGLHLGRPSSQASPPTRADRTRAVEGLARQVVCDGPDVLVLAGDIFSSSHGMEEVSAMFDLVTGQLARRDARLVVVAGASGGGEDGRFRDLAFGLLGSDAGRGTMHIHPDGVPFRVGGLTFVTFDHTPSLPARPAGASSGFGRPDVAVLNSGGHGPGTGPRGRRLRPDEIWAGSPDDGYGVPVYGCPIPPIEI